MSLHDSHRWTVENTRQYRAEVERRFRERTPAKSVGHAEIGSRVNRSEMRNWSLKEFGMMPPEMDRDWGIAQVAWTRKMIRRVIKELDPEMYETVSRRLRRDAHMQHD